MSVSFKLHRLQEIDSHLDHARARFQEIERLLQDQTALQQAQAAAAEANKALEAARVNLRRAEENVKTNKLKLEQTESSLYSGKIHNPKELQDLQNEAEALKRYLAVLDDRLLEAMIALEENEARYDQALTELKEIQERSERQRLDLNAEQAKLNQEVHRLELEREAAARAISDAELRLYEQLRKQKRGVGVASVSDRTCSACGSVLSSALLHAARSPNQLARCDSCGRILYGG